MSSSVAHDKIGSITSSRPMDRNAVDRWRRGQAAVITVLGLLLGLLPISANPQIIENPAKPPAANDGRVVTVREEMRIEDAGKDFTFASVWDIKVSPDGTIFVKDGNQPVLQFDPGGKFVRNLMKKGQGPGELNSVDSILLTERRILLQGIPPKILAFDFHGKLLEETNLASAGGRNRLLVGAGPTDFYLSRRGLFDPGQGTGWIDVPEEIVEFTPKKDSVIVVGVFPIKSYVKAVSSGRGGVAGGMTFHSLIIVPFGESKFVVNRTHSLGSFSPTASSISPTRPRTNSSSSRKAPSSG
ncbi:MAG: 6-bladed beta-propeller [Candidatus Aminicenantes bacterium]|nr:6-bladed beta-propeller [Candidatus Aminicenantes bacterium]